MIYTLTLNPALDYHIKLSNFQEDALNVALSGQFYSGGKGINVSKVLNNLKIQNIAIGILGGFSGLQVKKDLEKQNITTNFIEVSNFTRINVKLHNLKSDKETEINGPPVCVSDKEKQQLLDLISSKITNEDILVCSGSVPYGLPSNIYKIISESLPNGTKVVLDTRAEALIDNLHSNLLIKPNIKELEGAFNKKLTSTEEIIAAANFFLKKGVENIIVSLGKEGSVLITKDIILKAEPLVVKVNNSVGAGDSMVAGFLAGYIKNLDLESCYRLSIASALATVTSSDIAIKSSIEEFYNQVKIIKVKKDI